MELVILNHNAVNCAINRIGATGRCGFPPEKDGKIFPGVTQSTGLDSLAVRLVPTFGHRDRSKMSK